MRDEKLRAVVARSTSKSKCTKRAILGALLEVEMSNKCAQLRRKSDFQVKMYQKNRFVFDVVNFKN